MCIRRELFSRTRLVSSRVARASGASTRPYVRPFVRTSTRARRVYARATSAANVTPWARTPEPSDPSFPSRRDPRTRVPSPPRATSRSRSSRSLATASRRSGSAANDGFVCSVAMVAASSRRTFGTASSADMTRSGTSSSMTTRGVDHRGEAPHIWTSSGGLSSRVRRHALEVRHRLPDPALAPRRRRPARGVAQHHAQALNSLRAHSVRGVAQQAQRERQDDVLVVALRDDLRERVELLGQRATEPPVPHRVAARAPGSLIPAIERRCRALASGELRARTRRGCSRLRTALRRCP